MKPEVASQRLIEVCRRQHKSLSTERTYGIWLKEYISYISNHPELEHLPSERKLESFLTFLALKRHVAATTQNQAFNAIIFFYKECVGKPLQKVDALRATRPARVRHSIPRPETLELLNKVPNIGGYPTALVARLLYGCGLRIGETVAIRVKDLRLNEGKLFLIQGKGAKDRVVNLPCSTMTALNEQLAYARTIWERDQQVKVPVQLPGLLATKYPAFQFAWSWAWVFPQHNVCVDPRVPDRIVRWHMLEVNVQRAVKRAAQSMGLYLTPHHLRHCYATHCLERGTNIKAVAKAMGHSQITTTEGYCHAEALSVVSPLD